MRSLFEWVLAVAVLGGAVWFGGPYAARWLPRQAAPPTTEIEVPATPTGVPPGARSMPLLVLLDGTEVRVGMPETTLRTILSERLAAAPRVASRGQFGDRITRAYLAQGTRFWVVLERRLPGDEVRVSAIYLQ